MRQPIVFDGRNLFDVGRMHDLGFEYKGIGRRGAAAEQGAVAR
jgi:hypothetical protein